MNILITGADGFVGRHLIEHLLAATDATLHGTTFHPVTQYQHLADSGVRLHQVDLTDYAQVTFLLEACQPQHVYHLAAQSSPSLSFAAPWQTISNNVHAQFNVLHALMEQKLAARTLVIGSGEEYGKLKPEDLPVGEDHPLRPNNPYSVSKVTQDMLGLQYHLSYGLDVIRVRPFNHIGAGQSKGFVASDFASQIAAAEHGLQEPVIRVGILTGRRDFTDARDTVRAYHLLMDKGASGEVYNVGSGEAHAIQELLDILLSLSSHPISVELDKERLRPVEVPEVVCDATKLQRQTGWQPQYTFEDTLAVVLDDWRERLVDEIKQ